LDNNTVILAFVILHFRGERVGWGVIRRSFDEGVGKDGTKDDRRGP